MKVKGLFEEVLAKLKALEELVKQPIASKWLTFGTWGLVIVSGLVGYCHYQGLDEATFVQNRAYVHPEIPDTSVHYGELVGKIQFVNYGRTPAYDFEMSIRFERCGDTSKEPKLRDDPRLFPYSPGKRRSVIAPGEHSPEVIRKENNPWEENGYTFLYGKIWYVDFEGNRHFTSFGYVYEHFRKGFTRMPGAFAAD